jgi:hypothetical protein
MSCFGDHHGHYMLQTGFVNARGSIRGRLPR